MNVPKSSANTILTIFSGSLFALFLPRIAADTVVVLGFGASARVVRTLVLAAAGFLAVAFFVEAAFFVAI